MSASIWNKKVVAAIAVIATLGVLSPASAQAFDPDINDIVTATVDLGDGEDGGGGNTCTGYGTLTIPTHQISLTKERKHLPEYVWEDHTDDDNDPSTPAATDQDNNDDGAADTRNLIAEPIDVWAENTRTSYVSQPFQVGFDADNCVDSTKAGAVWVERQPVEQYIDFEDAWFVNEVTGTSGILPAEELGATANLKVDYNMLGVNRLDFPIWENIYWDGTPLQNAWELGQWGVADQQGRPPIEWGSSGNANLTSTMDVFGQNPRGLWRVKYGFWLEISDAQNAGPWVCMINLC